MTEKPTRRIWIASRKELYVYELVTEGIPEDIGMAYDLTITPMDVPPVVDGKVDAEIVADLVKLDKIRAKMGLYSPNPLTWTFNFVWRAIWADGGIPRVKEEVRERVYRVGHPKHPGLFG